jgi:hypothetical protein
MRADSPTAAVCGVWLEFLDSEGNTLAEHVVDDWNGRRVPARGEQVLWNTGDVTTGEWRECRGVVVARQFDLQHTAEGEPQLWMRLVMRVIPSTRGYASAPFSRN